MSYTQLQAWLDQEDARVGATIRAHGWSIEYIGGSCSYPGCTCEQDGAPELEGPPFAYTIGLFGMGHPELLIIGVPPAAALGVLNTLGNRIRNGENLIPGQLLVFDEWRHRIVPEHVPNPGDVVLGANRHYRRRPSESVPVLQLSYDDTAGRFPWEPGYAAPELQPRPGSFFG